MLMLVCDMLLWWGQLRSQIGDRNWYQCR